MENTTEPISVSGLLAKYDKSTVLGAKRIIFKGVEGKDVYNITAPVTSNGNEYLTGRVESRDSEHAKAMFFKRESDAWVLDKSAPTYDLQDPFLFRTNGALLLGGVEIKEENGTLEYATVFYRGSDIHTLTRFTQGPRRMKDIRPVVLARGDFGLFTRPQGEIGGRGRIGFCRIPSIADLQHVWYAEYYTAPLLKAKFLEEEWMGANTAYALSNGLIGVMGHIACFTGEQKNYYPMAFAFDPEQNTIFGMKIIATRDDLPPGSAKRPELHNVIFPGDLVRHSDGTATVYAGVSDAEAYEITIKDPFLEYEK